MSSSKDGYTDPGLQKQLRKTKFCTYHVQGMCQFGERCAFAHSAEELRQVPDLKKTKYCAFKGSTCKDPHCSFAHSREELRSTDPSYKKTLCIWYQKGCCRNGTLCSFAHGESELRQQGSSSSEQRALPAKAAGRTPTLTSHRLAWTNSPASGAPFPNTASERFNGPSQVQIQAAGSDWPSVQQSPPVGPYSGHGCMGCGGHMPEFEDPHLQGPFPTLNSCSGPVQGPMPLNHVEEAVASLSDNLQSLTQQLQLLEGITRQYQLQQYPQPP